MSQKPDPHISAEVKINLTILVLGAMVMILNETALSVALPAIMADFDIPATSAQWLLTGFLLTMGVVIPTTGFLMDKFTTRQIFIAALGLFSVGTTMAALAPSFGPLLLARVVQGLFAALMVPCYLYVLFYSVIGHRAGLPQDKAVEELDQRVDKVLAKRRWMFEQQQAAKAEVHP